MSGSPSSRASVHGTSRGSPRTTAWFLRSALATVAADAPDRYADLVRYLSGAPGRYRVDDETFTVAVEGGKVAVAAARDGGSVLVRVHITARALLRLVDGTASLAELLVREELMVRANPDALLNLDAAVRTFARAAVESGKLPERLEEYRTWVLRRRSSDSGSRGLSR
jgi:hypothetical protein